MAKIIAKLIVMAARVKDKDGNPILIKIIGGIVASVILLSVICIAMIGSFTDQDDVMDGNFNVDETEIYKIIDEGYLQYEEELRLKMDERESEIIAENTYTIVDENGQEKKVCNVSVWKELNKINYAYVLAYINHTKDVKNGLKADITVAEVVTFFKSMSKLKEVHLGDQYRLYISIKKPDQVATLYYPIDKYKQDMYLTSYALYLKFLSFTDEGTGDDDGSIFGSGYTTIGDDEKKKALEYLSEGLGKTIVEFALSKLGVPYSQPLRDDGKHYDCSSLTYYAYKSAGINIANGGNTTAAGIANRLYNEGKTISIAELQPGDLIYYSFETNGRFMNITHTAIYAGNGMVIDASSSKGYVVYRKIYAQNQIVMCGRP